MWEGNGDVMNFDDRIDKIIPRTKSVVLRCKRKGCKALFSTKNIGGIGARTIFPWFGYDVDGNTQLLSDDTRKKVETECFGCDRDEHTTQDLTVVSRDEAVAIAACL